MGPKSNQVHFAIYGGWRSKRMGFYSRAAIVAGEITAAKVAVHKKSDSLSAGSSALSLCEGNRYRQPNGDCLLDLSPTGGA
jgi:hypothetical protein